MSRRCDAIDDCQDAFDERNCSMIIVDLGLYRKEYPPLEKETGYTTISIDFGDVRVSAVDEFVQTFHVKFFIQVTW